MDLMIISRSEILQTAVNVEHDYRLMDVCRTRERRNRCPYCEDWRIWRCGWFLYIEGGYPAMKIGHPNPYSKTSTRTSTVQVSLGQWYHVAGVYNAGQKTLDMYVNGVLTNGLLNGLVPSSQRNSGQNINIARRPNNRRHFKGTLDDIRIYNRALVF